MTPWLVLLILSFIVFLLLLWSLKRGKLVQNIYELSPESHQEKQNTPTFGGIGIIISIGIGIAMFQLVSPQVFWVYGVMVAFSVLGFIDDRLSLKKASNKGLSAKQKFLLQWLVAFLFLGVYHLYIAPLQIGLLLFYAFMMVGASNATNLSDGLDGLLAGLSLLTMCGFSYYFKLGQAAPLYSELQLFSFVMMVAIFAFLILNANPAKIFMGDTGSLALGAGFAGLAIVAGNPWILIPLGAVYILETFSVMIQVIVYKRTKKRVFLMAPIHHHFELMGLSERQVVFLFWGFGLLFLVLFLVRI